MDPSVRCLALERLGGPNLDGNLRDGDGRIKSYLVLASADWMTPTLRESLKLSEYAVDRLMASHDSSLPMNLVFVLCFEWKTDLIRLAFITTVGFHKLIGAQSLHQPTAEDGNIVDLSSRERPVSPAYVSSNNRHSNLIAKARAVRLVRIPP